MFKLKNILNFKNRQSRQDTELEECLSVKRDWHPIYINKSKGTTKKKIYVPGKDLKESLRTLLWDFQKRAECHESVYSYRKSFSFADMAQQHAGRKYLLKTDIKSFFDNISQDEVRECLLGYYEPSLANKLATFVCHDRKLPFGSPFSPYFSNIYLKKLDQYLGNLCAGVQAIYTRYGDDIYISHNNKDRLEAFTALITSFLFLEYPSLKLNNSKTKISRTPFHIGPFTVQEFPCINLCKSFKRSIRVKLHKYSILELDRREIPELKGLLLFSKGHDPLFFWGTLYIKFAPDIDEIFSLPTK